jgi:hypothetical protein
MFVSLTPASLLLNNFPPTSPSPSPSPCAVAIHEQAAHRCHRQGGEHAANDRSSGNAMNSTSNPLTLAHNKSRFSLALLQNNHKEVVKECLKRGARINLQNKKVGSCHPPPTHCHFQTQILLSRRAKLPCTSRAPTATPSWPSI